MLIIKRDKRLVNLFFECQCKLVDLLDILPFEKMCIRDRYMEAMDEILPNVQKILLGADVEIDNAELWIGNSN